MISVAPAAFVGGTIIGRRQAVHADERRRFLIVVVMPSSALIIRKRPASIA
jgi:hypothetical protein